MSKSRRSSNASACSEPASCRLEWRPSRGLTAALFALAVLAAGSLLASELPGWWAWPLALLALGGGLGEARRHALRPPRMLQVPAGPGAAWCDGARVDALRVRWRGPLAFVDWRDPQGRMQRLVFTPDVLAADARRELRLAIQRREAAAITPSMAG